jgi:hypothetical protein
MAKADVLALVALLGGTDVDTVLAERFYREVVSELGQSETLVAMSLLPVVPGTGVFTLPEPGVRLIGVVYDDEEITPIGRGEVASIDPGWRDARGTPMAYFVEDETTRSFRLYPIPDIPSKSFLLLGAPLGTEYPEYAVVAIHTTAQDDVPVYFELPIALTILAHEFVRESSHRDPTFAAMCQTFALALLGVA